jgi:hypothetical protein
MVAMAVGVYVGSQRWLPLFLVALVVMQGIETLLGKNPDMLVDERKMARKMMSSGIVDADLKHGIVVFHNSRSSLKLSDINYSNDAMRYRGESTSIDQMV